MLRLRSQYRKTVKVTSNEYLYRYGLRNRLTKTDASLSISDWPSMRKLSRKKSNREHMIKNLAASLVLYEYIDTTEAKAKEVKNYLEKILARNKQNELPEKRNVFQAFFGKNVAQKIINELLPRYESRISGFTKTFHLKNRLGDNAEMMRIELVDKKVFVDKAPIKNISEKEMSSNEKIMDEANVTVREKKSFTKKSKDNTEKE